MAYPKGKKRLKKTLSRYFIPTLWLHLKTPKSLGVHTEHRYYKLKVLAINVRIVPDPVQGWRGRRMVISPNYYIGITHWDISNRSIVINVRCFGGKQRHPHIARMNRSGTVINMSDKRYYNSISFVNKLESIPEYVEKNREILKDIYVGSKSQWGE